VHFIIFINNYSNIIELSNATPTKPMTIARPTAYYILTTTLTALLTPLLQLTFGLPVIYCKYLRKDWALANWRAELGGARWG